MLKFLMLLAVLPLGLVAIPPDSLLRQRSTHGPVFFTAGYRMPLANQAVLNSGHGIYTEAGLNAAAFIAPQSILGIFAGWGWKDNLWATSFDGRFVRDYKLSLPADQLSTLPDSAIIAASAALFATKSGSSPVMPGCEMQSFHNYTLYYGLIFQLPYRYAPVIKVYRGSTRSHYQGPSGIVTSQNSYNSFQLRRALYGCEVSVPNPAALLIRRNVPKGWQRLGLGVYYEYADFRTAALHFNDGEVQRLIPLKQFLTPGFFNTWRHEHRLGLKLSYTFI